MCKLFSGMLANHETHRQILEAMPDGLYILDKDLIVHYLNPAIIAMLSRFKLTADLLGRKFTDVLPGAMTYLQDEIDKVYNTRQTMHVEHTVDLGTALVSYETVRIPLFDAAGSVTGVLNAIHDVTGFRTVQKELEESRRIFETMVDNANSIILRMDLNGIITYFNHFAEQFFGYTREEILGKSVQDTIIPENDSEGMILKDLIQKIVENPADYALNENENIKKDGTRVWISWSNKPVKDTDGIVRDILCVENDITALKNAQRELVAYRDHLEDLVIKRTEALVRTDRLASLGTLVSGVAHEINNPNNFISLNADNLFDIWKEVVPVLDKEALAYPEFRIVGLPYQVLREERDHLIDGIRSGSRRIRTIVSHLKDFSRQGPVDMDQEVDLRQVLEAASVIVANAIKKCTGRFESTIEDNLPKVKGDFQKLEQVVINLLTNACQALTARDQAVCVDIRRESNGSSVIMTVRDEGKGIDAEFLPYIFDPFFTTKRETGGTGLGLSISYGIVKDHNGSMEVVSRPGKGSTFTVLLPMFGT
jgi:PAS domain S-box-containing protein